MLDRLLVTLITLSTAWTATAAERRPAFSYATRYTRRVAHLEQEPPGPVERALRALVISVSVAFVALCAGMVMFAIFGDGVSERLDEASRHTWRAAALAVAFLALAQVAGRLALAVLRGRRGRSRVVDVRALALQPTGAPDCPFCKADLSRADLKDGVVRCPACEVAHHGECWRENGGCTTHACARSGRLRGSAEPRLQ